MAAKATVKKAVETKTEVKETAPEVTADVKQAEKAAPAAKKTAAAKKASAPKKEPAKRTTRKAAKTATVFVEYAGSQIVAKDVLAASEKDFAAKHPGVTVETIEIYIKPEEGVAYYVVNGMGSNEDKVVL